ncbi:27 kDa hemolymph protein [Papilio machaon]|uniref:27 kDa hemolymph protein n=1 Tax=Papilio machaon TaxID=76193 RepID=UPI001E663E2E|nr:27 kDa hemolymph protein [Papilio machaon]
MIWKIVFITFMAAGVLAEYQLTEGQRQQYKDMLRQQCKKSGSEDKTDDVEKSIKTFVECVMGLVDVNTLKREIEEAKPNGALDEVFKKYCAKTPQLKSCIHSLTAGVAPCLDQKSRDGIGSANNATDQLIDFVCYKDGDRIALFIAEGGPECFQQKATSIRQCAEKVKGSVGSIEAAQILTLSDQCGKFEELTSCIVKALEECDTPTPANMAESLFRYVRNGTPCKGQ